MGTHLEDERPPPRATNDDPESDRANEGLFRLSAKRGRGRAEPLERVGSVGRGAMGFRRLSVAVWRWPDSPLDVVHKMSNRLPH